MRPRDGRVVPAFIQQALLGEPLTVFGDGSQTRSFCYVDDLIEGIYRLLMSDEVDAGQHRQPARDDDPRSSPSGSATPVGSTSTIDFRPLPEDDPKTRQPDITKARRVLGWEPQVPLDNGLGQHDRLLPRRCSRRRGPAVRRAMSRSRPLVCARCGAERPRASRGHPFAARSASEIRDRVCPDCWAEWRRVEVMVINELKLNFMEPSAQEVLTARDARVPRARRRALAPSRQESRPR